MVKKAHQCLFIFRRPRKFGMPSITQQFFRCCLNKASSNCNRTLLMYWNPLKIDTNDLSSYLFAAPAIWPIVTGTNIDITLLPFNKEICIFFQTAKCIRHIFDITFQWSCFPPLTQFVNITLRLLYILITHNHLVPSAKLFFWIVKIWGPTVLH